MNISEKPCSACPFLPCKEESTEEFLARVFPKGVPPPEDFVCHKTVRDHPTGQELPSVCRGAADYFVLRR